MHTETIQPPNYAKKSLELEAAHPKDILRFALAEFSPKLLFTSAFGPGSAVLLHLWSEVARELPVVFIDTGFLFEETLAYKELLTRHLGLTVETVRPKISRKAFLAEHGDKIYEVNPDFCCAQNRIEPIKRVTGAARAWISGLRRDQGGARSQVPILLPTEDGPVKVHPLATFTARDMYQYLIEHNIPEHPLFAQGYTSVGCAPCTKPPLLGEGERSGRWAGTDKTECGLHTFLKPKSGDQGRRGDGPGAPMETIRDQETP